MAERGDISDDDSLCGSSSKLGIRIARIDSLKLHGQRSFTSSRRSGSQSPVPAWRRVVDLNSPSPPPPSPPPYSLTSMVTTWFSSVFKLQKVEPTGIRPLDAKCDKDHFPVVYNKQYDIRGTKKLGLPKQPMVFDKPAQVFSAIKSIAT